MKLLLILIVLLIVPISPKAQTGAEVLEAVIGAMRSDTLSIEYFKSRPDPHWEEKTIIEWRVDWGDLYVSLDSLREKHHIGTPEVTNVDTADNPASCTTYFECPKCGGHCIPEQRINWSEYWVCQKTGEAFDLSALGTSWMEIDCWNIVWIMNSNTQSTSIPNQGDGAGCGGAGELQPPCSVWVPAIKPPPPLPKPPIISKRTCPYCGHWTRADQIWWNEWCRKELSGESHNYPPQLQMYLDYLGKQTTDSVGGTL